MTDSRIKEFLDIRHSMSFTGHRPGKYIDHDINSEFNQRVAMTVYNIARWCIENRGVRVFRSGGALGLDQIAFWSIHTLKNTYPHIKNYVDIPFKEQPSAWKDKKSIDMYYKMLEVADKITYVDTEPHYTSASAPVGKYSRKKLLNRNIYMVSKSKYLIAFFDGSKGGTGHCFSQALTRGRTIYCIDPKNNLEVTVLNDAE